MTSTKRPLVSVVIPTFNRLAMLREAIASVFHQTYDRWELIVVDDGSTDGTLEYLRQLPSERVRVVAHPHCGVPARLRNAGIALARGTYLAFIDSDDLWVPAKLERQMSSLLASPACGWSYSYFSWIDERGANIPVSGVSRRRPCDGWILEDVLRLRAWVATPVVVAETALLNAVGGYDEAFVFSEDYELWLRLSRESPAVLVREALSKIRQHSTNTWRSRKSEALGYWVKAYANMLTAPAPPRMLAICRRQHARAVVHLADQLRFDGARRAALSNLQSVLRQGITMRSWWSALVKTYMKPYVPEAVLRRHHARRRAVRR